MAHYSRIDKAVIDVDPATHDAELAFWRTASGQPLARLERHPEYHGSRLPGRHFALLLQRLETGDSRVHLDIHTDDVAAEVARLERAGAERVREVNGWWIMRDPAGLLFCVIPEPPGSLNGENSHRFE